MESGPLLWLILLTAGVVVLGLAMAYAIRRNRTRTLPEKVVTEAATKREYRDEDRDSG